MDLQQLSYKIKHFLPWVFERWYSSGLVKGIEDGRDFKTENLGWNLFGESYTPKYNSKSNEINPDWIINQDQNNICTQCAASHQRMIAENTQLEVQSLTSWMRANRMLTSDGEATIDAPQSALQKYGIIPGASDVVGKTYDQISLLPSNQVLASQHKISTYWKVSGRDDLLKLLDDGKTVTTGLDWYSGYNQGGGFSSPWIISKTLGYIVGGHSVLIVGYNLNYNGYKVYKILNSYGANWGDNGYLYVDMDFLDNHNYGYYTDLGIAATLGVFLNKYNNQNVKKSGDPNIYYIQNQQKCLYPDYPTFLAYYGLANGSTTLSADEAIILNGMTAGPNMDIKNSPCQSLMSYIKGADNNQVLINALTQINYNKKLGVSLTEGLE